MMSAVRRPKPHPKPHAPRPARTSGRARAHAFAALSGFSALVYELLWLKQLGLLFGNTAHAAAVGLTVFFLGLAIGGWFWGRRAAGHARPLRLYAYLELGIAAAAILYFALLRAYHAIYAPMSAVAGDGFLLMVAVKFLLAVVLLGPAAFLIGGTYPVLGHAIVARPDALGTLGTSLYGVNTIGAAAGAFAAGFVLPSWIGFTGAYVLAMAINVAIGMWALRAAAGADAARPFGDARTTADAGHRPAGIWIIACGSGVLTLGLEVAWTRMFAQVLENSVYTFSIILVVFLVALGLGSWLASAMARLRLDPGVVLTLALTLAGVLSALVPSTFVALTSGLQGLGDARTWSEHVWSIARAAAILLPAGLAAGFVFPYLMRVVPMTGGVGSVLGTLVAVNTSGAIAGSLATGFVMLAWVGLWATLEAMAIGYLVLGVVAALALGRAPSRLALVAGGAVVAVALFATARLPLVHLDPSRHEQLVEAWEGPHGITAIVRQDRGLRLKLNNFYSLGGTADDPQHERNQTLIPLLTHPRPDAVFFLGLGAGVTAGEATRHPVQRIVVCELVPDVIEAARKYFAQEARGLFADSRATILAEDGRSYLAATPDRFDVVISDLFVPWHAGTGSLYSREHFDTVRRRLTPGGVFVQWLPLFQLSRREFFTVARTMLEVFPQVVMWRGDFYANKAIVALVGSADLRPLNRATLRRRIERLSPSVDTDLVESVVLTYYMGNLTAGRDLIPAGPLNTDDRPVVEYLAPRAAYERSNDSAWFQSHRLAAFQQELLERVPPGRDPYLAGFSEADRHPVRAGLEYYRAISYSVEGNDPAARKHVEAFLSLMPSKAVLGGPFLSLDKLLNGGS
jgi:spermidine synthase